MSSSIRNSPIAFAMLGLAVIGALLVGWTQGSFASTPLPSGSGELEVGGEIYEFATDTCSITEDGFVASGPGMTAGERFWISASNDSVDLAVGTSSIAQAPDDDDLWLTSFNQIAWDVQDSRLSASMNMRDDRVDNPAQYRADLSISCSSAT